MQKTHYDTLKVSRDAPIEVIRAAYRVLSQKYHPDRQPANPAAADTMGLLNKAYEVLSDPDRRREHDAWIRQIEAESSHVPTSKAMAARPARVTPEQSGNDAGLADRVALHLRRCGVLYGSVLLVLLAGVVVVLSVPPGPQLSSWVAATPPPEDREAYIRRLAREVMLPRIYRPKDPAAVPAAPDTAASPSDNSPVSATEGETPVEQVPSDDDAPRQDDAARPATPPGEEARSTPELLPSTSPPNDAELSSASPPNEPELPSVSQPNADTADRGTSFSESQQGSTEAVAGTE